jgi:hypothetical protein
LPEPLARGIVFQKPGIIGSRFIDADHRGFGGAKRNGVEAIENMAFRKMPYFAPVMISKSYASVAKPFLLFGEWIAPGPHPLRTREWACGGGSEPKASASG